MLQLASLTLTTPETWPDSSSVDLKTFSWVQLTRVGICADVLAIRGEMMLARRMPRGLAEEGKEKCTWDWSVRVFFCFLSYVKNKCSPTTLSVPYFSRPTSLHSIDDDTEYMQTGSSENHILLYLSYISINITIKINCFTLIIYLWTRLLFYCVHIKSLLTCKNISASLHWPTSYLDQFHRARILGQHDMRLRHWHKI